MNGKIYAGLGNGGIGLYDLMTRVRRQNVRLRFFSSRHFAEIHSLLETDHRNDGGEFHPCGKGRGEKLRVPLFFSDLCFAEHGRKGVLARFSKTYSR